MPVARRPPDAFAGGDDAGEVQRIGGADRDEAAVGRRPAHLAQPLDRVGQRELLARHAGHEAAAADLAARLEPAVDARQLAPRRGVRLARQQPPEHDAVAAEQRPRLSLDGLVAMPRRRRRATAPSSVRRSCARRSRGAGAPARRPRPARAGRRSRRTRPGRRRRARRSRVRSRSASSAQRRRQLAEERRAARAQHVEHVARRRRSVGVSAPCRRVGSQRRHASACSRRNSAIGVAGTSRGGSPVAARRRQPRPADLAGQAQHVEHRRLVAVDPRRQDARAPTRRRRARSRRAARRRSRRPSSPVSRSPARRAATRTGTA